PVVLSLRWTTATPGMPMAAGPVVIGTPLMVPTTFDDRVTPLAGAVQLLFITLSWITPPSNVAPSTEDCATVVPVFGSTVQLALSTSVVTSGARFTPTMV